MLNLPDIKLGLDDLVTKRHAALVSSKVGKGYEDILAKRRDRINALPPALTSGKPLAEELANVDSDHDGFGGAIYFITEAYLRLPNLDPKIAAAATRARAALIPKLEGLRDSYADEAAAAIQRKADLAALKADLDLIPVAGGATLYTWAQSFVGAGEKLHTLLSARADADTGGRKDVQKLRSETVGLLNRVRAAIADEAMEGGLPGDIDNKIFGYFDELESARRAALRPKEEGTGPS